MKNKSTQTIPMPLNHLYYKEVESRLEQFALDGLILEKINNNNSWIFTKSTPTNLKYTITYFNSGWSSNSSPKDTELTYLEYIQQCGWDLVCESGQMQIFSTTSTNPIPFEKNNNEILDNIHIYSKKNFVYRQLILLIISILNLLLKVSDICSNPLHFFSNALAIQSSLMFMVTILLITYILVKYYLWYNKATHLVALGKDIPNSYSKILHILKLLCVTIISAVISYMCYGLAKYSRIGLVLLVIIPALIYICLYISFIFVIKKLKLSTKVNKIITITLVYTFILAYISPICILLIQSPSPISSQENDYRTISWKYGNSYCQDVKIYNHNIPLKCEDLYSQSDLISHPHYVNYSYKKDVDETIFIKVETYSQSLPPIKDDTLEIEYTIYTPKYDFIRDIVIDDIYNSYTPMHEDTYSLLQEPVSISHDKIESAYHFYHTYEDRLIDTGLYLLISDKQIVIFDSKPSINEDQLNIVIDKLFP